MSAAFFSPEIMSSSAWARFVVFLSSMYIKHAMTSSSRFTTDNLQDIFHQESFVEVTTSSDDQSSFLLVWNTVTILQYFLFCKRQNIVVQLRRVHFPKKEKHAYPCLHQRQVRSRQKAMKHSNVRRKNPSPSGTAMERSPNPARSETNSTNRTIPSASLICFEVSSTRTVFPMVHLTFQSPEGMTSACSGRWFMV